MWREVVQSLIIYGRPPRLCCRAALAQCAVFHLFRISASCQLNFLAAQCTFIGQDVSQDVPPDTLPPCSSWHNGNRRLTLQFLVLLLWLLGSWPCRSGCGNNCLPRAALSMGNLTRPRGTGRERHRAALVSVLF